MTIEVEAPDGSVVEFPDGTSDEVIQRAMAEAFPSSRQRARPQGYNDAAGASSTYAHGATFGLADEIAGVVGGGVEGARSAFDPSRATQVRAGRQEDITPEERRSISTHVFDQSAIGHLLDVSERTGQDIQPLAQPQEQAPTNPIVAAVTGARRGYEETAGRFRDDYHQFQAERPIVAAGTEITGALLSPVGRRIGAGRFGGANLPVIGGGGVRQAIRGGVLGGALYGVATGENLAERTDIRRVGGGALLGGGGGALLGTAGRVIGGISGRFGLNAEQRAARMIERGLRDGGITPQEVSRRAGALRRQGGQTYETVAEVGGPALQRQARAVANVRGPGQGIATDTLETRAESITPRVLSEVTRATRPQQTRAPQGYYDALEALRVARTGQGAQAYRIAHQTQIPQQVVAQELLPLMQRGPKAAINSAITQLESAALRAQSEGALARRSGNTAAGQQAADDLANIEEAIVQLRAVAAGQTPNSMNARALDYYQRGLGQMASASGYKSPEGAAMEQARQTFNSLLDQVAPQLGQARQNYGASIRIEELMAEGRRVFNMPEGEIDVLLRGPQGRGLSLEEFDGFMLGVMDAIESKLRSGDTRFILRFMNNENWQRQLERALGKQGARRLRNRIAREASMRRFDNAIRSGSQTTPLAEDIRGLTQGEDELSFLSEVIQSGGNVRGPALRAIAGAYDRIRKPGIHNERVNEALARRLYGRATRANLQSLEAEIAALPGYSRPGPTEEALGAAGGRVAGMEPNRRRPRRVGGTSFAE